MGKRILRLHLKKKWWEQIECKEKPNELRQITPYWTSRLEGRVYDEVWLMLGYPSKDDLSRIIKRKFGGVTRQMVAHEEFNYEIQELYVIWVDKELDS